MEKRETLNEAAARLDTIARQLDNTVTIENVRHQPNVSVGTVKSAAREIRQVAEFIRRNT